MRKILAALALLTALSGVARANYVYDNTALPSTKSNLRPLPPGADATKYVQATDFNSLMSAINDLRGVIVGGKYFGFDSSQTSAPSPAVASDFLWFQRDAEAPTYRLHLSMHGTDYRIPMATVCADGQSLVADDTVATGWRCGGEVSSVAMSVPSWLSVSGSPITTSGTLAVTATTGQTANFVLATPNGSTGAVSLRALVAADIPAIAESGVTGLTTDLTAKALKTTTVSAGTGLSGGGDLSTNRTLSIDYAHAGTYTKSQRTVPDALVDGATITIDFNSSDSGYVTLGGNRTIAFSNMAAGSVYMLQVIQDGTGSRTLTWPASVRWSGGSAPVLTTTAGQHDDVSCKSWSGSVVDCSFNGNFAP